MIPDKMFSANSEIRINVAELVCKKICRFCLRDTEDLVDIVEDCGEDNESTNTNWRMILSICFTTSSIISKNLPKYACEQCCEFVKRCYEFQKLCRRSEFMLMCYTLTGSWTQSLDVPEWLHPAKKRQLEEEEVMDSQTCKRFCSDEVKDSQATTVEPLDKTQQIASDSEDSLVRTIRVRPLESLTVQRSLQSPTISSENIHTASISQCNGSSNQFGGNQESINQQPQHLPGANPSTVPNCSCSSSSSSRILVDQVTQPAISQSTLHEHPEQQPPPQSECANSPTSTRLNVRPHLWVKIPKYRLKLPIVGFYGCPNQAGANQESINQQSHQLPVAGQSTVRFCEQNLQHLEQPSRVPSCPSPSSSSSVLVHQVTQPAISQSFFRQTSSANTALAGTQTTQPSQPLPCISTLPHFRCIICSFQFINQQHLALHMRNHDADRIEFRCSCGERICGFDPFVTHLQQRHLTSSLDGCCYLCGEQQLDADWKMLAHLERHREEKLEYACDFCLLIFPTEAEWRDHVRQKHWTEAMQVIKINPRQKR